MKNEKSQLTTEIDFLSEFLFGQAMPDKWREKFQEILDRLENLQAAASKAGAKPKARIFTPEAQANRERVAKSRAKNKAAQIKS